MVRPARRAGNSLDGKGPGLEKNRSQWNEGIKELRELLDNAASQRRGLELCLELHAAVHTAAVAGAGGWSFEDEVLGNLDEAALRHVPASAEHSLVWMLWHMARCEDITMNLLVAGTPQVWDSPAWQAQVHPPLQHTGNAMDRQAVLDFSAAVDAAAVRAYRQAVGNRSRQVIRQIQPDELKRKVDPARHRQVAALGVVIPQAQEVLDYWGSRTIAGLLLMPATRHNFVHLNEALRLKPKLLKIRQG